MKATLIKPKRRITTELEYNYKGRIRTHNKANTVLQRQVLEKVKEVKALSFAPLETLARIMDKEQRLPPEELNLLKRQIVRSIKVTDDFMEAHIHIKGQRVQKGRHALVESINAHDVAGPARAIIMYIKHLEEKQLLPKGFFSEIEQEVVKKE